MKRLIPLFFIVFFLGCSGSNNRSQKDSIQSLKIRHNQKEIDSKMAAGDRPDSEQEEPTFNEVLADQLESYNKIVRRNTLIVDGKDSLQVHFKYYCLHDSSLVVPKKYLSWGGQNKDFITHNFASDILIIKNKDTILNKTFLKKDFLSVLEAEQLRKYATFVGGSFNGYDTKIKDKYLFGYSMSIPLTDLGVPVYIAVDKDGSYKVLDQYAVKY